MTTFLSLTSLNFGDTSHSKALENSKQVIPSPTDARKIETEFRLTAKIIPTKIDRVNVNTAIWFNTVTLSNLPVQHVSHKGAEMS